MKYIYIFLAASILLALSSCDKPLNETPLDFYSPENSFNSKVQFESALANIYLDIRTNFYAGDGAGAVDMLGADLDIANCGGSVKSQYFFWPTMNADNAFAAKRWTNLYTLISQANTIINRAEAPQAVWNTPAEKNAIVAEARFIRAFAYHFLANMWGDVPLVLKETKEAKFDQVRAPQKDVYLQCKADLDFATQNMPTIDQLKGGRAPREAAYHLLAEINICLKDYDAAIAAASTIINGGKLGLMTARFGVNKNFTFSGYSYRGAAKPWGDVYWDLFQAGNMNWKEGNREAIWNISQDATIKGGNNTDVDASGGLFLHDRIWGAQAVNIKDKDVKGNWLMDTLYGRCIATVTTSSYADKIIWNYKGDFNRDMRNSEYNIERDYYFTNPTSVSYGQLVTKDNVDASTLLLWETRTSPHYKKFVNAVPKGVDIDATSKRKTDLGRSWKDWYIMRLPETYLLRAEANMLKGDMASAAIDINVVRARANATPVTAGDVNMDLILDERARELYGEEFRLNTLMRTGKLVEYLNKYNGYLKDNGLTAPAYVNKLPIPRREIEANTGAKMPNNPGY